jgi:hypothetical protein
VTSEASIDQGSKPSPEHLVELFIVDDPPGLDIGQAFLNGDRDSRLVIECLEPLAREALGLRVLHGGSRRRG